MKVATLFATLFITAVNAFAPSTPLSTNVRSGSSLSMSMERTYIMVSCIGISFDCLSDCLHVYCSEYIMISTSCFLFYTYTIFEHIICTLYFDIILTLLYTYSSNNHNTNKRSNQMEYSVVL